MLHTKFSIFSRLTSNVTQFVSPFSLVLWSWTSSKKSCHSNLKLWHSLNYQWFFLLLSKQFDCFQWQRKIFLHLTHLFSFGVFHSLTLIVLGIGIPDFFQCGMALKQNHFKIRVKMRTKAYQGIVLQKQCLKCGQIWLCCS